MNSWRNQYTKDDFIQSELTVDSLIQARIDMQARHEVAEMEEVALSIVAAGVSVNEFDIKTVIMPNGERFFSINYGVFLR